MTTAREFIDNAAERLRDLEPQLLRSSAHLAQSGNLGTMPSLAHQNARAINAAHDVIQMHPAATQRLNEAILCAAALQSDLDPNRRVQTERYAQPIFYEVESDLLRFRIVNERTMNHEPTIEL